MLGNTGKSSMLLGTRNIFRQILTTKMRLIGVLRKKQAKQLNKPRAIKLNKLRAKKRNFAKKKITYIHHFKAYLNKVPNLKLSTPLGKCPPRNMMTEKQAQVSFPIKTGGSEKF